MGLISIRKIVFFFSLKERFAHGLVNLKDGLPNSEMEWSNEYMGLPVVRKKERKQNKGITLNILLAKLKSW